MATNRTGERASFLKLFSLFSSLLISSTSSWLTHLNVRHPRLDHPLHAERPRFHPRHDRARPGCRLKPRFHSSRHGLHAHHEARPAALEDAAACGGHWRHGGGAGGGRGGNGGGAGGRCGRGRGRVVLFLLGRGEVLIRPSRGLRVGWSCFANPVVCQADPDAKFTQLFVPATYFFPLACNVRHSFCV